ncbi:hypothetical protein B0I27_11634 [Arcticibacter pallidicorallinus]|uniref:Endosialidase-like protein n=1 Tax=Arcticibacter pallidicorallinus TaxID=1259464 RepID=A0A2T0TQY7_9SPHI|nr:hypothetical protein [Arcticibacter pallidicorallinus]PRY48100.1 hypothetical protein B0I27_11634 [Arcticibacter pallidicorallinus]
MKNIIFLAVVLLMAISSGGQTLQTVTQAGNTTSLPILLTGGDVLGPVNQIQFKINAGILSEIGAYRVGASGQLTDLYFSTGSSSVLSERLRITHAGDVGIGTSNPQQKLDVGGNLLLRNQVHQAGAGACIFFSSYKASHAGPRIRSYLDYAGGSESSSRLILSSYNNGYEDELTLMQGKVGIGMLNPTEKLWVNGNIRAKEIKVENGNWPDYVFDPGHVSMPLLYVEQFIQKNKHLPEIPSAKEVRENGVTLGEMNSKLLKKIEEMTLYMIEQHKRLDKLQSEVDELRKGNRSFIL